MTAPTILVAGIGNIFLGDDGFGVEVANRLATVALPPGARVVEYGIRGLHLALDLLDGCDVLVLVDALPIGEPPGTVVLLEPDVDDITSASDGAMDAHAMSPVVVLRTLASMGGRVERVLVVGCQPAKVDEGIGLSPEVAAAVASAVTMVEELVVDLSARHAEPNKEVCS
jgi:hydrogenase maturation protease